MSLITELHRLVPHPEQRGAEDRAEDHRQQQVRLYDVRGQLESVQELRGRRGDPSRDDDGPHKC